MMSWHEILPSLGEFINKTGFPVGLWLITGFVVYKLGKKIFVKIEPIVDAHFELVTELKNSSSRATEILEKQNDILVNNFSVHTTILNDHTAKLDSIMKGNLERNEILEDTKRVLPINGIMSSVAGASNGSKR
jgi:hypothetical protein